MSRPSIHGTNPYLQVPTRIAGTQKMGELFPSDRPTTFVEARTSLPSQDGPRGGRSHQPDGDPDPPDDSSDDELRGPRKLPPPPPPRGNPKDISRGAEGKPAAETARFDLECGSSSSMH